MRTRGRATIPIIAISGSDNAGESSIAAGATTFVHKPFDPLELLTLIERMIGVPPLGRAFGPDVSDAVTTENLAELGELIEIGRRRHELLDRAYRQTLSAIATSLEIRGLETSAHTERVTAYAMRLTVEVAPSLSDDAGLEWGFMFHDVGNIGVPDRILLKRGSLKADEWRLLHQHTTIGEQLLSDVPLLGGEGLRVVRSHHERWDGTGYPDGLRGTRDPARRPHLRGRRRPRRDDRPPALPPAAPLGGGARADPQGCREAVRPGRGRRRCWPASPTWSRSATASSTAKRPTRRKPAGLEPVAAGRPPAPGCTE